MRKFFATTFAALCHLRVVALAVGLLVCAAPIVVPAPASAQLAEVPNTPRATINGVTVGVWDYLAPELGCVILDVYTKQADGWHGGNLLPTQCYDPADLANDVASAGGGVAWVTAKLPLINAAVARAVGQAGQPPPTGSGAADTINATLSAYFAFKQAADGSYVLAPK